jgi:hypothetical protein
VSNCDFVFNQMMIRASERCFNIAAGEKIMGYTENVEVYLEIANECRNITSWVVQYRNHLRASVAEASEEHQASSTTS